MPNPDSVLVALIGTMTASKIAERVGEPNGHPIDTLPILYSLQAEGRVHRRVDVEGAPVARWRAVTA